MSKKIVLALGGNALGDSLSEQMVAVQTTSSAIVDLIQQGHQVIVTHGNGPQVGMINVAFEAASKTSAHSPVLPMSVCVALSQGYIGYDLQNALREELLNRGINKPVTTLITQVVVDAKDPAFIDPSKPIGSFFSKEEADAMIAKGAQMKEDAGRGYRRVVASPKPTDIVEKETVRALMEAGQVVITAGGGGIPGSGIVKLLVIGLMIVATSSISGHALDKGNYRRGHRAVAYPAAFPGRRAESLMTIAPRAVGGFGCPRHALCRKEANHG